MPRSSVIGIITLSAYKLTRRTIGRDRLLWALWHSVELGAIAGIAGQVVQRLGVDSLVPTTLEQDGRTLLFEAGVRY